MPAMKEDELSQLRNRALATWKLSQAITRATARKKPSKSQAEPEPQSKVRNALVFKCAPKQKPDVDEELDVVELSEDEQHVDDDVRKHRRKRAPRLRPRAECGKRRRMESLSTEYDSESVEVVDDLEMYEQEEQEEKAEVAANDAPEPEVQSKPLPPGPGIRALKRQWKNQLEVCGTACFNPLQRDEGVEVDARNLSAECTIASKSCLRARGHGPSPSASGYGVKALPMIAAGRYQYEVELQRTSSLVVGWSVATSLPSGCGLQSMGYRSNGLAVGGHGASESKAYGPEFGAAGDVIGALLDWTPAGPQVSFAINGKPLGVAFALPSAQHAPLQPHIFQAPGPAFSVLLRGASTELPLRFPIEGYAPIGLTTQADFCSFSLAVERASEYGMCTRARVPSVARRLIFGSLGLELPLAHVAQERLADPRRKPRRLADLLEKPDSHSDSENSDCCIVDDLSEAKNLEAPMPEAAKAAAMAETADAKSLEASTAEVAESSMGKSPMGGA